MTRCLALLLSALALVLAACGDSGGDEAAAPPPEPAPAATAADFPQAEGRTLQDILTMAGEGPVLAPAVSVLERGSNRFGFALFDRARKQLSGAPVALYVAKADGSEVRGPFLARSESLAVEPEFQSTSTSSDPDSAKSVYVAELPFPAKGEYVVTALVKTDGGLVTTGQQGVKVGGKNSVPDVGDPAIEVETETIASSGGNIEMLTTRRPPARELLKHNLAEVLGRQPVVLSFATPALCASRTCGPVVDIVEQVRARSPEGVAFIQQEIYEDNQPNKGVREQVAKWGLPSEPWTFVIDKSGKVVERFEGPFSAGELQRAVAKVAQ